MSADLERRLLEEYLDQPRLNLSLTQAARLLDVDVSSCRLAVQALIRQGWLSRDATGLFVRPRQGDVRTWNERAQRQLVPVDRRRAAAAARRGTPAGGRGTPAGGRGNPAAPPGRRAAGALR
ncbi:MAG: hypothetical protein IT176_15530 [Acidobacteria bacterium]|nr:hypothetical protein [Acidobacteriota bacterium]